MNVTNRITLTCRLLSPSGAVSRLTTAFSRVQWSSVKKDGIATVYFFSSSNWHSRKCANFDVYSRRNLVKVAKFGSLGLGLGLDLEISDSNNTNINGIKIIQQVERRTLHSSAARTAAPSEKQSQKARQIVRRDPDKKKFGELTTGEKVARVGKDATYTGIIVLGIGVTCVMFYAIGRELFSNESSSGVYGKALKLCKKNYEVSDTLGEPIKGYGETTRRGRRRYVSNTEYEKGGVKYMRMKFYVSGTYRKGTVHLEVKKNLKNKYEYRYLFVELDGYPARTIVLEDNRNDILV